jgi:hypothetical protein
MTRERLREAIMEWDYDTSEELKSLLEGHVDIDEFIEDRINDTDIDIGHKALRTLIASIDAVDPGFKDWMDAENEKEMGA